MKVLMISSSAYPVPAVKGGAVETLVTDFINENEKANEVELEVITRHDSKAKEISDKYKYTKILAKNFDVHIFYNILKYINSKLKKDESTIKKYVEKKKNEKEINIYNRWIVKQLKKNNYDFIIIEGGNIYNYEPIYKYIPKEKAMFHIHGVSSGSKFASERFGTFLAISEYVKSELLKGGNVLKENVELLYNGVELSNFKKILSENEKKELREKYNIKEDEKVIVFCGRTIKEKGVKELLLAFKQIYSKCNAKLLIIGNSGFANTKITSYDKELYEISKDFEDRIIFTGHIYNKELYKYYNISDIAVFPHIWNEAFGLVLVEAMASGKPILTTYAGAIPEVVSEECGILMQKENKDLLVKELSENMVKLLNDEELCKKLGENTKRVANKFSSEVYYKRFIEILKTRMIN